MRAAVIHRLAPAVNFPARLLATFELFQSVETERRPLDAVTSAYFRAHREIEDKDRGVILEWLYAIQRHRGRLGWWLERLGWETEPLNLFLGWLVLVEGKAVEDVTRVITDLTERDRALLGKLAGKSLEPSEMPEAVRLECPEWAEPSLRQRFEASFAQEMAATLVPPPVDLRVNPLKSDRAAILDELRSLGLSAEPTPFAPFGIRVTERFSLSRLGSLKSGAVEIQDEGSQLVALLLGAQPRDRVVDFCAGAGGKTLAIAADMQNKGRIVACDVSEGRLKRCSERVRGAAVHNVETRLLASETDRWVKRHKFGFDRVLIDAPCSGTGTWRRNPDTRWRASEDKGLEGLVALQSRILASAARLVKAGGRLVYATCSMMPEENEERVKVFLSEFPDFKVVPLQEIAPNLGQRVTGDFLSLTPAQHEMDGFFAAVLERQSG